MIRRVFNDVLDGQGRADGLDAFLTGAPATYDQPAFEIRRGPAGAPEARRTPE